MVLYVACVLLLCRGPRGLVIRASDWYSEGLGFKSQMVPEFLLQISFSLLASLTVTPLKRLKSALWVTMNHLL